MVLSNDPGQVRVRSVSVHLGYPPGSILRLEHLLIHLSYSQTFEKKYCDSPDLAVLLGAQS